MLTHSKALFFYTFILKATDALCIVGVWWATWHLRFHTQLFPITKGIPNNLEYKKVILPLALIFCSVFHIVGLYERHRIRFGFKTIKKIFHGALLSTLVFISVCYLVGNFNFSRLFLFVFSFLCTLNLILLRAILEMGWKYFQTTCIAPIQILVLGESEALQFYVKQIQKQNPYPIHWMRHLGGYEKLESIIRNTSIDIAILESDPVRENESSQILEFLSNENVTVKVIPSFGKYSSFNYRSEQECGVPILVFNEPPMGNSDRMVKRFIDIAGSLLFIVCAAPLYFVISILIKATSKGPIFYSQKRVGADNNSFMLLKFRSMIIDAEKKSGAVWAVQNDERTTWFGKWLRKTSLDEIPQFFNVLKGDMSLVGPRPERPIFVDKFRKDVPKYMLRHSIKSGITGWAQVNGWRGNTSIHERIKHDIFYIRHWSHLFDIKILVLTIFRGFKHKNAY